MSTSKLTERLKYNNLNKGGTNQVRTKRLKNAYKQHEFANDDIHKSTLLLPYYVVIDFEATCLEANGPDFVQEIIEFPAVLVNSEKLEVEDTFQMYCKPWINPQLSDFCVTLTGITQDQVDSAENFKTVLHCFETWLKDHELGRKHKFAIVTDSSWDMCHFLLQQCLISAVPFPTWGRKWVNLKREFCSFYKCKPKRLNAMLREQNMEFEGRLHCGLDDAKNIARLLIRMIGEGANVRANEKVTNLVEQFKSNERERIDVNELSKKMRNLRLRSRFSVIKSNDGLLTFEKTRKEREILELKKGGQRKAVVKEDVKGVSAAEMKEILEWLPAGHLKTNKKSKKHKLESNRLE